MCSSSPLMCYRSTSDASDSIECAPFCAYTFEGHFRSSNMKMPIIVLLWYRNSTTQCAWPPSLILGIYTHSHFFHPPVVSLSSTVEDAFIDAEIDNSLATQVCTIYCYKCISLCVYITKDSIQIVCIHVWTEILNTTIHVILCTWMNCKWYLALEYVESIWYSIYMCLYSCLYPYIYIYIYIYILYYN